MCRNLQVHFQVPFVLLEGQVQPKSGIIIGFDDLSDLSKVGVVSDVRSKPGPSIRSPNR